MGDQVIGRIAKLLEADEPRRRIAAAVVLGELGVKDPEVVARLCQLAQDPLEAYATAALGALEQIRALKALPVLLEALGRGGEVGKLAARAVSALGEEALPLIRERLKDASPEVRALYDPTTASPLAVVAGMGAGWLF